MPIAFGRLNQRSKLGLILNVVHDVTAVSVNPWLFSLRGMICRRLMARFVLPSGDPQVEAHKCMDVDVTNRMLKRVIFRHVFILAET